jgi:ferredoxin
LDIFAFYFLNLMKNTSCILFCECGAGLISENESKKLKEGLKSLDVAVYELHDLCAMSLNEKEVLGSFGGKFSKIIVLACYPRAVNNMLKQGEVTIPEIEVINFRNLPAERILSMLSEDYKIPEGTADYSVYRSSLTVPAWYPVIDHSLCTECGKCASFCLFGVYRFDRKSLKVINPLSCKNNCPACARVCPGSAIIFPRFAEKSVIAGAEPGEVSKSEERELSRLLMERNRNRKNIIRDGFITKATEERLRALKESGEGAFARTDVKNKGKTSDQ